MQRALLRTAQEVAKGMDYIHSFGIVHGDLKPGNVLLKTHRIDRRGYIAKVSDFGEAFDPENNLAGFVNATKKRVFLPFSLYATLNVPLRATPQPLFAIHLTHQSFEDEFIKLCFIVRLHQD